MIALEEKGLRLLHRPASLAALVLALVGETATRCNSG